MAFVSFKLGDNDKKIVKAEYINGKLVGTFSNLVIKIEFELGIKDKKEWDNVFFQKEGETDWKPIIEEIKEKDK